MSGIGQGDTRRPVSALSACGKWAISGLKNMEEPVSLYGSGPITPFDDSGGTNFLGLPGSNLIDKPPGAIMILKMIDSSVNN